jgi:hypothetical protein
MTVQMLLKVIRIYYCSIEIHNTELPLSESLVHYSTENVRSGNEIIIIIIISCYPFRDIERQQNVAI